MRKPRPPASGEGIGRAAVLFDEAGPLRWEDVFPRKAPVDVEIGSGKGRFLLAEAARRPERNFLGIERRVAHLRLCAERAERRGLQNIRLLRTNAIEALWGRIETASVGRAHVYYPDPWWKARHKKRRIFTPEFVADLARALEPEGELRVATDVEDYFDEILQTIACSGLFEAVEATAGEFGTPEEPLTSYQAKYQRLGRSIHGAAFRRNLTAAPPTPEPRDRLRLLKERRRAEKQLAAAAGGEREHPEAGGWPAARGALQQGRPEREFP